MRFARLSAVFLLLLTAAVFAEKEDESNLAYESGLAYAAAGDSLRARKEFERAASAKGDFSDLARVELLRIQAQDGKTALSALTQALGQIKDQTLQENAYMALASSLKQSRRYQDAVDVCLLLAGRMPESSLADDALLMAAGIFLDMGAPDAARLQAEKVVSRYKTSDSVARARLLLARSYLIHDENYAPALACKYYESASAGSERAELAEFHMNELCGR